MNYVSYERMFYMMRNFNKKRFSGRQSELDGDETRPDETEMRVYFRGMTFRPIHLHSINRVRLCE